MEIKANYKSILKIALPLILANLVGGVGQIIDTAFVNRIGEKELNGTVVGTMIWMFFAFILLGFSSYVQQLIAKKIGAKEPKEVGGIIDNVIVLCVFLFVLILFFYGILRVKGLSLMLQDNTIVNYTFVYLDVLIFCLPVSICISFLSAFFSALGKTSVITYSIVVYIIVNLILDYLLIFGNLGFPELGIKGAALATVIAILLSSITYVYYVYKTQVIQTYELFRFKGFNKTVLIRIIYKSMPLVLQNIFNMVAYWVFFMMIEKMGSSELRLSLIIRSLYLFLCLPIFGLGTAINTVISNLIGRKDFENINKAILKSHEISFGISVLLCLLIFIFPELLLSIYADDNILIQEALPILKVVLISILLFSISTVNINVLIAIGNTKQIFIISVISVVSYLLFAYVAVFWWKTDIATVWLSDSINWSLFALLSTIYFFIWKKKQKKIKGLVN